MEAGADCQNSASPAVIHVFWFGDPWPKRHSALETARCARFNIALNNQSIVCSVSLLARVGLSENGARRTAEEHARLNLPPPVGVPLTDAKNLSQSVRMRNLA